MRCACLSRIRMVVVPLGYGRAAVVRSSTLLLGLRRVMFLVSRLASQIRCSIGRDYGSVGPTLQRTIRGALSVFSARQMMQRNHWRWWDISKASQAMALLIMPFALVACGAPESAQNTLSLAPANSGVAPRQRVVSDSLAARLLSLDSAVSRWQRAPDLNSARRAAEEARNVIVGAAGPYYGDGNEDGRISGANSVGILPGLRGEAGLASPDDGPCVVAHVLGGSWQNPAQRWATLETAISRWTSVRNPFPYLPSHIQRVVGWASLALKARDVTEAREYARHARLHVDVALKAVTQCEG